MRFLAWGRYVSCDSESEASELLGKGRKKCATPEPRRSGDPVKRWKVRVDCEGPENGLNMRAKEGHTDSIGQTFRKSKLEGVVSSASGSEIRSRETS